MKLLEGVGPAGEEGRKGARATQNSHCSWDPCRLEEQGGDRVLPSQAREKQPAGEKACRAEEIGRAEMEAREPWSAGRSFLPLKRREEQPWGQRCLGADGERTIRPEFLITRSSAIRHGQSACAPLHTRHILEGSGGEVLTAPLHAALGTTRRSPRHSRGSTLTHSTQ